ncbi:MAG TPA: pyruvate kinase [Planctomycetota bacterium]|nr:pyruvate kinase [Planctomycetota bacterium]
MRTKIVATLGPASDSPKRVRALIEAGVDVFRLNFSHGTHAEHATRVERIRRLAKRLRANVCVLQDLQGPKIRTGRLEGGGPVVLKPGTRLTITTRPLVGNAECVSTSYRALPRDVHPGDRVLLDDGLLELRVLSKRKDEVHCEVVVGGPLGEHKGINLPGVLVSAPAMTAKDRHDLAFGLKLGVDAVALSFVRRAADVLAVKRLIRRRGGDAPVVAKIEQPEAVDDLSAILDASDGVMVARGDLGVEMPPERVPVLQKRIIREANRRGKPVTVATQMLESMVRNPRPTRAEASDVANAIFDGTDAVMLSAETSIGRYPVAAVAMMARIAEAAETVFRPDRSALAHWETLSVPAAVADAAVRAAEDVRASALVVFTISGATARLVAQRRPACPIHAFCPVPACCRRLALVWGVEAHPAPMADSTDALIARAQRQLVRLEAVRKGQAMVLVGGATPLPGATNIVKVLVV